MQYMREKEEKNTETIEIRSAAKCSSDLVLRFDGVH